ncbi:MAG: hypothetical protein N4A71_01755 [Carboxylicivirga sp.]|jgi:hypothetical protein|nr:hypothetical protein [Carboxylicivirga sp.]
MKYTSLKIDAQLLYMDKPEAISKELTSFLSDLKIPAKSVALIEVYATISNRDDYASCSSTLTDALSNIYKDELPAHRLIANKPVQSSEGALFRISLCSSPEKLEYKTFQKHHYSLINNNGEKTVISGAISFDWDNDAMRSIQSSLDFVEQLLDHEEMHFGHIARQVNYLEDINSDSKEVSTGWNILQTLDEIRQLYFDPTLFKHGYPLQSYANVNAGRYVTAFIASAKDGFPTARLVTNEDETLITSIPGLNTSIIGNFCNELKTSTQEQLSAGINQLKKLLEESNLSFNKAIDEIKVTISDEKDLNLVEKEINDNLTYNKLTLLQAQLKGDLKVDIEVFASLSDPK